MCNISNLKPALFADDCSKYWPLDGDLVLEVRQGLLQQLLLLSRHNSPNHPAKVPTRPPAPNHVT
jgi:hypothetical protein